MSEDVFLRKLSSYGVIIKQDKLVCKGCGKTLISVSDIPKEVEDFEELFGFIVEHSVFECPNPQTMLGRMLRGVIRVQ
ncbi:hypothetical protein DRO97_01845 [Archaeoglobales archaeon]|nr:MAG: hypothetical protein DRO97_01845 [Archaeoglobales archaeon]